MGLLTDPLRITVLGSGTSMGVPTIGCHCDVCNSSDPRDNRLRPSILVSYGEPGNWASRHWLEIPAVIKVETCSACAPQLDGTLPALRPA